MNQILSLLQNSRNAIAVLVDPEKFVKGDNLSFLKKLKIAQPDFIFIGGSTVTRKDFDACVNVNWPLMHYKSAVRYLQKSNEDIAATGGTNWQKYLPPRIQKRIFYPELWNENEMQEWGKSLMELGK